MAEVNAADLKPVPSAYQSSRALNDVLIGDDRALPLFEASSTGDITTLRTRLEESPDIALESPHRIYSEDRPAKDRNDVRRVHAMKKPNVGQAILRAAENGHVAAVTILLEFASRHGLQPSSVIDRDTVIKTVQNGHAAVFDALATADPQVATFHDHRIKRPLDWALRRSNIELMKVILQHGGGRQPAHELRGWGTSWGWKDGGSRLSRAAAKKDRTALELLLQQGYTVKGSGALQSAAERGNLDTIRLLVEDHGADVNELLPAENLPRPDNALWASWTPLHFAACQAGEEAMELLESYGAKADVLDVNGRTPLQLMEEWKQGKSYTRTLVR